MAASGRTAAVLSLRAQAGQQASRPGQLFAEKQRRPDRRPYRNASQGCPRGGDESTSPPNCGALEGHTGRCPPCSERLGHSEQGRRRRQRSVSSSLGRGSMVWTFRLPTVQRLLPSSKQPQRRQALPSSSRTSSQRASGQTSWPRGSSSSALRPSWPQPMSSSRQASPTSWRMPFSSRTSSSRLAPRTV